MRISKGSFKKDYIIDLNTIGNNLGNLTLPSDPAEGAGNFALVTGNYDRMQDILAKLGMGDINSFYELELGTEMFDLYNGDNLFVPPLLYWLQFCGQSMETPRRKSVG
ncbi:hypothetical protein ES703_120920 [subsurface metagenome]